MPHDRATQISDHASHQQLLQILDAVDDVIYVADPETFELLYVNEAFGKQWGGEVLGRRCHEVLQGRTSPCPFCSNELIFGDNLGESHTWEFRNEKNGRWYRCVDRAILWEDGRWVRMERAVDITEAKASQVELRKFSDAINQSPMYIIMTDPDGVIEYVNPAFTEITGYTAEEVLGHTPRILKSGDTPVEVYRNLWDTILSGKPWRGELKNRKKDGSIYWEWATISPSMNPDGEITHIVAVKEDITARKEAEASLRSQQQVIALNHGLASAFLTAPRATLDRSILDLLLLSLDAPRGFVAAVDDTGYVGITASTEDHWLVNDQPDMPAGVAVCNVARPWQPLFESRRPIWTDAHIPLPDGSSNLHHTLAVPLVHGNRVIGVFCVADRPGGFTGTDRDLLLSAASQAAPVLGARIDEDRQRRRREDVEAQYRQSQKMEAVGQLAGGVAHDFNNLLTVINNYAELSVDTLHDGDPMKHDVQQILTAGKRAASLTRQLLAFSRKQVLEVTVLDLNEIVTELERMLQRLIGEDIDLQTRLARDLGHVNADPGQLEQVIMNLALNARDAMPGGGRLTIETANVVMDEEYARSHSETVPGPHVMLAVSDTGVGMNAETRERIFEPFFTTKEKGHGTGLGLATVYGVVKQSGGSIWVYSEEGRGTTFKVYLPQVAAELTTPATAPETAEMRGHEAILVVEDEPVVRELAERILTSAGYQVVTAANGGEALLVCEQIDVAFDLMLTDVIMPRMGGKVLADRLAELRPGLRVLYMSGYTDNAIVHHGVLDEGTPFIAKPFNTGQLLKKVRAVLDQT